MSKSQGKTSSSAVFPQGVHLNLIDDRNKGNKSVSKVSHNYGKMIHIEQLSKSPKASSRRPDALSIKMKFGSIEDYDASPDLLDVNGKLPKANQTKPPTGKNSLASPSSDE